MTVLVDGGLEYVGSVGEWKNIGEGPQKKRQCLKRNKQAAEENHWKTKEIGEGLCLEDFFNRHRDKKAEQGRSDGNQENGTQHGKPADVGKTGQKRREKDRNERVKQTEEDGPARFSQHEEIQVERGEKKSFK